MGHLIDLIQDNFHDHWDATILPLTHGRQGGNGLSLLKFWPYVYLQHSLQVHRLIVVDEGQKMYGVVSLSDILNFLVLKPFGKRACVCVQQFDQTLEYLQWKWFWWIKINTVFCYFSGLHILFLFGTYFAKKIYNRMSCDITFRIQ